MMRNILKNKMKQTSSFHLKMTKHIMKKNMKINNKISTKANNIRIRIISHNNNKI